jgi:hypothetical protein
MLTDEQIEVNKTQYINAINMIERDFDKKSLSQC